MQFKAFKPQAMQKIAGAMGYTGDMNQFQNYIEQDPMRQQQMQKYNNAAMQMARGGVVRKMAVGGTPNVDPAGVQQKVAPVGGPGGVGSMAVSDNPNAPRVYFGAAPTPQDIDAKGPRKAIDPAAKRPFDDEGEDYNPYPPGHPLNPSEPDTPTAESTTNMQELPQFTANRISSPGVPVGGVTQAASTAYDPAQYMQPGVGQLEGSLAVNPAVATTAQQTPTQQTQANVMQAQQASTAVNTALEATQAAQATLDPRAEVMAAQQTASSVGNLQEAQGNAILMDNPQQREIQDGELISGSSVDATKIAQATAQIQAAEATPSTQATVQGQLTNLMADFDDGATPAWAAGAMRNATAQMAARGLGSSSMAGQAIIQAAMESAIPIAQADANTIAKFESQNLTNRQQSAMIAAEQRANFLNLEFTQDFQSRVQNAARVSDIANMNFTADQQIALENSRNANTVNLQNLSNSQAMVMAEAAALSQLDTQNLNNRQQASVQNAQSFLQVDMANLSNQQQTELFKGQQRIQSMFTDQAAENASRQFNATSQNQVDQFFANLSSQTSQFNAAQQNAQSQFNAGQVNTVERFNAEMNNQRDTFNAQNQMVIQQSNAQWRREIATADTAAVNRANELNANAVLDISKSSYDNLWSYYADTMEWAWTSADNAQDRMNKLAIAKLTADSDVDVQNIKGNQESSAALGGFAMDLFKTFAF